jgi:hypothetical protein
VRSMGTASGTLRGAHRPVAWIRGGSEHQRAPAVDDSDPLITAVHRRRIGDAARAEGAMHPYVAVPRSAHSRIMSSAISGLVPITTALTPPGIDFRSW